MKFMKLYNFMVLSRFCHVLSVFASVSTLIFISFALKLAFGLVLQAWRYIFVYKSCECDVEASIKAKYWWWRKWARVQTQAGLFKNVAGPAYGITLSWCGSIQKCSAELYGTCCKPWDSYINSTTQLNWRWMRLKSFKERESRLTVVGSVLHVYTQNIYEYIYYKYNIIYIYIILKVIKGESQWRDMLKRITTHWVFIFRNWKLPWRRVLGVAFVPRSRQEFCVVTRVDKHFLWIFKDWMAWWDMFGHFGQFAYVCILLWEVGTCWEFWVSSATGALRSFGLRPWWIAGQPGQRSPRRVSSARVVSLFISSIQYIKNIKGGVIVHMKNIKHPRIFPFDIF
jgi:hypothetical protein